MNNMKESNKTPKFQRQMTPSKIPLRSGTSQEKFRPPSRIRKPSSADSSLTVGSQSAVFDLNGRKIRTNSEKAFEIKATKPKSEETTTLAATPRRERSDLTVSKLFKHQPLLNTPDQVNEFMKVVQQFSLDKQPSSKALKDIPNSPIGDSHSSKDNVLAASESHPVFDYCYDGDENVPSSTSFCDETCLERVVSRCCFTNICNGENFETESAKRKPGFPWLAFWSCMSIGIIAALLAVIWTLNSDYLMMIWNGGECMTDPVLPPPEESFFDRITNFLRRFWLELKDMIVLDELEVDDVE